MARRKMESAKTGRVNVYIRYEPDFFARLRPAHDSAADHIGELTEKEMDQLRGTIARFIWRCHERHGKLLLDAAIARGEHA